MKKEIFGYLVEGTTEQIKELIELKKDGNIVNWFNFKSGDIYYNDDAEENIIQEINHDLKYVKF